MALILTSEQTLLQDTARDFVTKHAPVSHMRKLRDAKDEVGFSRELWKQMADLGWTGIVFDEKYEGTGLGYAELGLILEEAGRTLMPHPFMSTVMLGGGAVEAAGSDELKKQILPGVCEGKTILALAFQEQGRFHPYKITTNAEKKGDGYALSGNKMFVLDGHVADHLIVAARTSGNEDDREGITLFMVDPGNKGLKITRTLMVDSRNAANLTLEAAQVGAGAVLGEVGKGADVLDTVFDRAAIGLSAELLGLAGEAYDRTLEYLKTRVQFGVPIGSFQALKHRAARMFCEVELARSVVLDALRAIDDPERDDVAVMASAAKARASDMSGLITREAIQMHGGIGMTDEHDIGLFLKRAKAAELTLGDAAYHRDRFARLQGF